MITSIRAALLPLAVCVGLCSCIPEVPAADVPVPAATTPLVPQRRAFVPLKDLQVLVEQDRTGVLMPRKEFEQLLRQAEAHVDATAPPAPQVIARCEYAATIVGDQMLVTVTADLEQLAHHWKIWKFPLQRLALEQATIDDQPALIGRTNDHALTVVTHGLKRHRLKLQFSSEVVTVGSDRAAGFSLLPSAAGELTLSIEAGKRLLVDGAELDRPQPIDQPATYRVAVGGKPQVQLRITDRATDRTADALTFATSGYGLVVAPGEVTWHVLTNLQVFGRPVDRLTLSIPGYLEIADVESTGLEAWELQDDPTNPQRTKITLTFGQPFEGSRKVAVRGVMAVPTGDAWSVPPLTIENVNSHVGQIVVQHPAGVRLQVTEAEGVRRATDAQKPVSDMPEDMPTGVAVQRLRFDAWREDFSLRLIAAPKEREVHAAIAAILDIASAEVQLQAAFTVTPRYAPLFDLDVDLPAEWTVLSVAGANDEALTWRIVPQEPGTNRIRIPLAGALAPGATTVVKLRLQRDVEGWPVESEPVVFPLPELVAPQANVVETAFVIRGDDDLDFSTEEITGLDAVPLAAEWERLRYQSQDTRYSGRVKVTRRRAQTAVETINYYRLDRQSLAAKLFATMSITGGGVREVIVSLPESVPETTRFQAVGGTLVEQQQLDVQNGRRHWRLQFAERVLGNLRIWTEVTMPRTDAAAEVSCPLLEVAGADRAHGAVVTEAGADQRLTISATSAQGQPLLEMDPLDLPPMPYQFQERIVAVHRTIGVGNVLTLTEQRFEKAAVPTAVCTQLDVLTIVSRTGELQQRARFALRLAGVQQLQVELPAGAELWAATLNDDPVEIRRATGKLLIALPGESSGDFAADLQIFYRSATASLQSSGTLEELPPTLSVFAGQGSAQPVDVLEQTWEVIHPHDTLVIDSLSPLEPSSPLDQPGWFAHAGELIRIPRIEDVAWLLIGLAIVAGGYAFLILLYRRLGMKGFWVAVACCGVLGLVITPCLLLPAVQQSREAVSQIGSTSKAMEYALEIPAPTSGPTMYFADESAPAAGGDRLQDLSDTEWAKSQFESGSGVEDRRGSIDAKDRQEVTDGARRSVLQRELQEELKREKELQMKSPDAADLRAHTAVNRTKQDSGATKSSEEQQLQREFDAPMAAAAPAEPALFAGEDKPRAEPANALDNGELAEGRGKGIPIVNGVTLDIRQSQRLPSLQGLLSLALELDRPEGTVEKTFRSLGGSGLGTGVPLQIEYIDRRGGAALRGFLFAVGLVFGWWLRRDSLAMKTSMVALGLAVGFGLSPAAPVSWQIILDGIVFAVMGLVLAWIVFSLGGCIAMCRRCCDSWRRSLPAVLALVVLSQAAAAEEQTAKAVPGLPPIPPTQVLVYDDPAAPLAADRVFVPYTQFVELYRLAHPEHRLRSPAPTTAKLVESLYSASVAPAAAGTDPQVVVKARSTILSFVDGQQPVDLPVTGVILKSAQLDGTPAAIVTTETPWKVLIPKPGLHVLDLEFAVPSQGSETAGSFAIKLAPTPAAKLAFTLPQPTLSARVNGSTSVFRRVTRADATQIEFPVDAGGDVQIAWQPDQARGGAAVVHVESVTAVSVVDAGVSVSVGFNYRVRQGIVRDVTFLLPEGLRLQGVAGPDVGGWELVGDAPQRKLRVFLRRNVNDGTQLTLDGFLGQRIDQEVAFRVPEIAPQEVTTEAGSVAVYVGEAFSIRTENVTLLNQVDAAKFEPAVPVSRAVPMAQVAYRFSRRPWTLDIRATRLTTQLRATLQQGVLVTPRKVQLTIRARCELLRMPRSSLAFQVPADWLILDVQSAGLLDWYRTPGGDDSATVTLDYAGPQQGTVDVVVTATQSKTPDATLLTLGTPQLLGAERQSNQLAVWLEEGLIAQPTELGDWIPQDATTIANELRQLRPSEAQLAYNCSTTTPKALQLALTRLQPRLSASSLTVVTVTDVALVFGCVFQWEIARAATEVLTLETPAWLSGRLQFQGSEIRDAVPVAVDNQTTRWTITLRGPVRGRFRLAATASLPPATDRVPSPGMKFLTVDAGVSTPVETQHHYVLLINTSLSQLTSVDPSLVEPVQREDVELVVRQELVDQATEFVRLLNVGVAPSWTLQRFTPAAAVPAAVNLADLLTVVARNRSYHAVATYTIKNRNRQFLAIRLPQDSRLLSVLVNRQASRAVTTTIGDNPAYLIALPKTSAVDLSFPVQVIYAGQLAQSLPSRSGMIPADIDLPTAEVIGQDESPEYGIPVARTQWTIYLPDDVDAAPLRDPLRHNLNVAHAGTLEESVVSVLLSDAEEIINASGSATNYYSRSRALNNLKQLDQALQSHTWAARGENQQAQQAERLKGAVEKLEKSLENGDVVEFQVPGMVDGTREMPLHSEFNKGAIQGGDAKLQLGRAITNNSALIMDNGNEGVLINDTSGKDFGFYNFVPQTSSGSVTAEQLAQQMANPAAQGNSLQARQLYQSFNNAQLDGLNRDIAAGKKMDGNGSVDFDGDFTVNGRYGNAPAKPNAEMPTPKRNFRITSPGGDPGMAGMQGGAEQSAGGVPISRMDAASERRSGARFVAEPQPNSKSLPAAPSTDLSFLHDNLPVNDAFALPGLQQQGRMGGGMGGGFGVGGMGGGGLAAAGVGDNGIEIEALGVIPGAGWTQPGGLSLPFELPTAGQKLTFSKAGGDAKLALRVRTRESFQRAFGLGWAIVCIGVAMGFVAVLQRPQSREALGRWLPLVIAIIAAVAAIFLVGIGALIAVAVFVVASGVTAWMHRDTAEA